MGAPAAARSMHLVLVVAGVVCLLVALTVLVVFDGWEYYRAPLGTRGYLPSHQVLRPSGWVGLPLGIAGAVAMLSTLPYAARKRWTPLKRFGTVPGWLEVHIFFGIVGPVLVTLHTSFKFNGLISVGYWLMMAVWASGFVGRYLYVRIPKSIRGAELTRAEVDGQLLDVRTRLSTLPLPEAARAEIEAFEATVTPPDGRAPGLLDLFLGELRVRVRLALIRRHLRAAGVDLVAVHDAIALASDRAVILRRLAHLQRTRHLFELWHVFHRPLVYGMFVIVGLHVAVAIYLGYARWGA
jgi:hypothetical protein